MIHITFFYCGPGNLTHSFGSDLPYEKQLEAHEEVRNIVSDINQYPLVIECGSLQPILERRLLEAFPKDEVILVIKDPRKATSSKVLNRKPSSRFMRILSHI